VAHPLAASPIYLLLHSWGADFGDRRFVFDVTVNIAVYVPLGMSAFLAFRRFGSTALELLAPVALGTLLSAALEMAQLFTPNRQCSSIDLMNNILGSALGVVAGIVFTKIVDVPTDPTFRVRERGAAALLFCWASYLLFPLIPVLSLGIWRAKLSAFANAPLISPVPTMLSAAEWFAVGRLFLAAGARSPIRWLLGLAILVPIQFGIVNHSPMPADFEGVAVAALIYLFLGERPYADRLAGIALLLALALRGLSPFHFEGPPRDFLWIPFGGLLATEWQSGIAILLGKLFAYGASIWLLDRGGMGGVRATGIVTLVLACIEALQTRIPGHVAEINDPLLALLLGLGLRALSHGRLQRPLH
jgi:VanZ family protein